VIDTLTHLRWQQEPTNPTGFVDYGTAQSTCATLSLGGKKGWRLPHRMELASLVDLTQTPEPIDAGFFFDTQQDGYWTQTPFAGKAGVYWVVDFLDGGMATSADLNLHQNLVRCVLDPDAGEAGTPPCHRYVLADESVAVDEDTGLHWQRTADSSMYNQSDAASVCSHLDLGALTTDWRLPTLPELVTLVDDTRVGPALDPTAFPGEKGGFYWTSSSAPDVTDAYWALNFTSGKTDASFDGNPELVRCVHE
jgi:hypothetical protein